jgi:hypothetical protein
MIAFYRGTSILSRLIKWFNWSRWSHVSWIEWDGDKSEIEAWQPTVQHVKHWGDNHTKGTRVDLFDLQDPLSEDEHANLLAFLTSEIGCGYDYFGIVGFILRIKGPARKRWFCSELIFEGLLHAKRRVLCNVEPYQVSPGLMATSPDLVFVGYVIVGDDTDASVNPLGTDHILKAT